MLEVITADQQEELNKKEVVEFLTTVMRGRTPLHNDSSLCPDMLVYDFVSGSMVPKLFIPKMSDRIKACEQLIKIHGLVVEKTENSYKLLKDEHFEHARTFLNVVTENAENAS